MSDIETAEQFAKRMYNSVGGNAYLGGIKARDAAIALAAKKEVFADAYEMLTAKRLTMTLHEAFERLLAKHGITPAELEPVKVYTVGDIKLDWHDFSAEGQKPHIICGEYAWCGDRWESGGSGYFYKSKHDAEAIAKELRATGNVPGGGA